MKSWVFLLRSGEVWPERRRLTFRKFGAVFYLTLALLVSPAVSAEADISSPLILMMLWRGATDAERGFQEYFETNGLSVRYEIWNANKRPLAVDEMLERIPDLGPDLIYTFGTTISSKLVKYKQGLVAEDFTNIPQVFNIVADPWGAGLTSANTTGVSHSVPVAAQIEAIKELDDFQLIATLFNPLEQNSRLAVAELKQAAELSGLVVESVEVSEKSLSGDMLDFRAKLTALKKKGVELIYLPSDSLLISRASQVIERIHNQGLLTFSATEAPIREGGALIGIVSRYRNVGQLAAYKAKQILFDGQKADDIRVETLSRFSFIVNMKTAHQLNYYPPVTMMQFAEVLK